MQTPGTYAPRLLHSWHGTAILQRKHSATQHNKAHTHRQDLARLVQEEVQVVCQGGRPHLRGAAGTIRDENDIWLAIGTMGWLRLAQCGANCQETPGAHSSLPHTQIAKPLALPVII